MQHINYGWPASSAHHHVTVAEARDWEENRREADLYVESEIAAERGYEAYVAYDGEVDTFVHNWQGYIQDEDFPCPDSLDGLHYVTSGSCDMCGDKNRD